MPASARTLRSARKTPLKGEGPRLRGPSPLPSGSLLLDLDGSAGFLELTLDRVGLVLRYAFLHGLRRGVDQVLGLLQAQAGDGADDLDYLDLLAAGSGQDDVERGLLLGRGGAIAAPATGRSRDGDRSGGGDAPLLLDLVLQLDQLEDAHAPQLLENGVDSSHLTLLCLVGFFGFFGGGRCGVRRRGL